MAQCEMSELVRYKEFLSWISEMNREISLFCNQKQPLFWNRSRRIARYASLIHHVIVDSILSEPVLKQIHHVDRRIANLQGEARILGNHAYLI
jgi:hypothetical protein